MTENVAKNKLLSMIENGDITAEEGLRLLNALSENEKDDTDYEDEEYEDYAFSEQETDKIESDFQTELDPSRGQTDIDIQQLPTSSPDVKRIARLKKWWFLPFGIGLILTVISSIWMYLGYSSKGFGWGFWLSWIPFILGVVTMALSALSSKAKWLHLRIKEHKNNSKVNLNLSFPLPLGLARWFFRNFGDKIKGTRNVPIDMMLNDLDASITDDSPLYIKVDDDGDDVEIFIG
ncbi:MAG: hypothetical protein MUO40_04555 [Anaerolineaceae bacterium]|nr:hypothetical protein [Anaerolineaceae bacterium]